MKYKLLAIDIDGTLVGPDNVVSQDSALAAREAQAAGLRVCLATGRSYVETMPVWRQLGLARPYEPMVLVGGALVSEPETGRSLYSRVIPRDVACGFAEALADEGLSAMAIVDVWRHGVDYFLAESPAVHAAQRDWFSKMQVSVRRVQRLSDAADMPDPLRLSAVVAPERAASLAAALSRRFDGTLTVRAILAPNYQVTIVEAFAAGVDKFAAVRYVAQAYRIAPSQIIAVGDDVNDLGMIRGAGLGVAMPQAREPLRSAAGAVAEPSLLALLRRILAGEFDHVG
ncbi:MAG TPA: HAD family hydrolase [Phycisphaerae bacterium]|nr:HAD family hydrolase [Phycisphaerae bacterium]